MEDGGQRKLLELAAERLLAEAHAQKAASSYDFVKIKVRLGSQLEHYYILSRFLLSRMLTVITLPQHKAVRIALDVKKQLVDHGRLDITQEELEEVLFGILRQRGYGDEYVRRYQMVTRFFQQKRPLIILIAGSACTGKSSLAQQLASRLNLPNVLQTDVLYELLRTSSLGDLPAEPLWRRPLPEGASLVGEFQRECATIRRALDGDLCKCIRDGKSIIVEGMHIDPGLFLLEFGDPRSTAGADLEGGTGTSDAVAGELPQLAASAHGQADEAGEAATQLAGMRLGLTPEGQGPAAAATPPAGQPVDPAPHDAAASPQQTAAALAAATPPAVEWAVSSRVRRTASFGDAVHRLSYVALHRLQSPWRGQHGGGRALARPMSARLNSLDRGQVVFMLQSPEEEEEEEDGRGAGRGAPPSPPSPRPAACISLPAVLEHSPQLGPRRSISLPASARRFVGGSHSEHRELAAEQLAAVLEGAGSGSAAGIDGRQASAELEGGMQEGSTGLDGSMEQPDGQQQASQATAAPPPAQQQQRPPSSIAAADAAAAAAAGVGPVFVPICLSMRDGEYEGLLHDWLARQHRVSGLDDGSSSSSAADGHAGAPCAGSSEAIERLRQLQAHLRQYASSGVPVVEFNTGDMGQALDAMHNYVLQCIEIALSLN